MSPDAFGPGTSRREAVETAARRLAGAGIDEPRREATVLVRTVLGLDAAELVTGEAEALGAGAVPLSAALERRARHEPLSRIVGRRAFWTLDLEIGPETLDPRPETETVVEVVLAELRRQERMHAPLAVLDVGTGSGAILIALLSELPQARGTGVDVSCKALKVARRNAERNGLGGRVVMQQGHWLDGLTGPFDVIVSNPPYIPSAEIDRLETAVRSYDPRPALDGGPDGLAPYRAIIPATARLLAPGGIVAVEIGETQGEVVDRLMAEVGLGPLAQVGRVWLDSSGRPRCVAGKT